MCRAIFMFALLTLIPAVSALGHPPGEIELEFDLAGGELEITAFHSVRDSAQHYVDRIVVKLNGNEVVEQKFMSQTDSKAQIAEYIIIDAKSGDEIEVIVGCNVSGQKKVSIVVEEKEEQEPEQAPVEAEDDE